MEIACPNCTAPFDRTWRKPRCGKCADERRQDWQAVLRDELTTESFYANWNVKNSGAHPVRALLDGAVPIGGKVFFFNSTPYIAAKYREEVKALL